MKKRKDYLITGLLFFLFLGIFIYWGILLPPVYEESFLGELKYKVEGLKETSGKRVVFLGGSGVAFGVDSKLFGEYFPDYTPVNFGMYGGLGTSIMMDLAKDYLREGDLVILMPEQEAQSLSDYFGAEYFWQAADGAYKLLLHTDKKEKGRLLAQYPIFAADKARYFLSGRKPKLSGIYRRDSFDENGDIRNEIATANLMPEGYDRNQLILFEEEMLSESFIEKVRNFTSDVQAKGVEVYYHFCPMNALAVEAMQEAEADLILDAYCDNLRSELKIPLLGDPKDSILDAGWFYDTNFHLNSSGKRVFTITLIKDLKAELGDSREVDLLIPDMPETAEYINQTTPDQTSVSKVSDAGLDHSDESCFLYEEIDSMGKVHLILTGLTREGLSKTSLIVPSEINNIPVSEIGAGTFDGAKTLREVTIQSNIRLIEDGAFRKAPVLKKLLINNDAPQECLVGQELLEDCDAMIYVPKEALDQYKLSYNWSPYASRLKANK